MRTVYRPAFGKYLSAAVIAVCAIGGVSFGLREGWSAFSHSAPWLGLIAFGSWALMWRPEVVVDDGGVHLHNVLRTIDVPWPAIQRIDTKWALTLFTPYGAFTAWAAPAPSRFASRDLSPKDLAGLPESTYGADKSIRPGDSPNSPSGQAARNIRSHWESLRDAGHLDDPRLEFETAPVTWHRNTIALTTGLLLLGLLVSTT